MAKRVQTDIVINKDPHEIYFFIADVKNLPLWSDIKAVEVLTGEGGVETTFSIVTPTFLGRNKTPMEIVKNSPHSHFAFSDKSLSFQNEIGFMLEPISPGKTKVTGYQEMGMGALVSLLSLNFITSRDSARHLSKMLTILKQTLENE